MGERPARARVAVLAGAVVASITLDPLLIRGVGGLPALGVRGAALASVAVRGGSCLVLAVVALPLTYLPVLLIAGDRSFMDEHANGRVATTLGWIYFAVMVVLALAAIPLLLATNAGGG